MMKNFFKQYIDRKKLITDLFRVIIIGLFLLFWQNKEIIFTSLNKTVFRWIGTAITYEISIPLLPLILFIILILLSSYYTNKIFLSRRIKRGKIINNVIDNWIVTTNKNNPQWTAYQEIPLNDKLFKNIDLELKLKSDYLRFGFKLLDKKASLFGSGGILNSDNNFLVHVVKEINDNRILLTAYKNGIGILGNHYVTNYTLNNILKIALTVDKNNKLSFLVDNKETYSFEINPVLRERVCLMAWGDGYEYDMEINNIKFETIN
jgi:hypothetical protein